MGESAEVTGRNRYQRKLTVLESVVIAVIGLVILVVFFMPNLDTGRETARVSQCRYNMKQLGLAFHNYHDACHSFPSVGGGDPPVSWRVLALPYVDQAPLYPRYNQRKAWDLDENLALANQAIPVYQCPSDSRPRDEQGRAFTAYAIPLWRQGLYVPGDPSPALSSIRDGLSTTIAIVEACGQRIIWSEPRDIEVARSPVAVSQLDAALPAADTVLSSFHDAFAHATFADGGVRRVNSTIDSKVLTQLLHASDGQPVRDF